MDFEETDFQFVTGLLPDTARLAIELQGGPDAGVELGGAFSFSESLAAGTDNVVVEEFVLTNIIFGFNPDYDIA